MCDKEYYDDKFEKEFNRRQLGATLSGQPLDEMCPCGDYLSGDIDFCGNCRDIV